MFERVAASLRPGGRFALNAFAFSHTIAARLDGATAGSERRRPHDSTTCRPTTGSTIRPDDGDDDPALVGDEGRVGRLVDVAGLEVEALYGWFDRRPFDDESLEFVYVTRKP